MPKRAIAFALLLLTTVPAVPAQDETAQPSEIERLVAAGNVTALESRLSARGPDELRLLARAQVNKADLIREAAPRQRAFEDAERRYTALIATIEASTSDLTLKTVLVAAARLDLAVMYLTRCATPDLDEFEISNGQRGDTARLLGLLKRARTLAEQVALAVRPLADELEAGDRTVEDRFLALGIYDQLRDLTLDVDFNLGWANLSIARVDSANAEARADALRSAERSFRSLLDAGALGENTQLVHLGLAMTLREQRRFGDAERYFANALDTAEFPIEARARYELARSQLAAGQFDEARLTLKRLVELNIVDLGPTQQGARFYMNLARLWDANSYLVEGDHLTTVAQSSAARRAILQRAERAREIGLAKLTRLADEGGFWPGVVDLYVSASIPASADPKSLSPLELLFTARRLAREKKYDPAVERLSEGLKRADIAADLRADLTYELGLCHYWRGSKREAAAAFDRVATDHKNHPRAVASVTYAYQLWAELSEESRQTDDYGRLAGTLTTLLQSFPEHEQRKQAEWWLPLALQSAGRYEAAAERFAAVPAESPQWEEAQYRRVHCQRLALEQSRAAYSPLDYAQRAQLVVSELRRYVRAALERAAAGPRADTVRHWAGLAELSAAELLVAPGVEQYQQALDLLGGFEERYADAPAASRALATRIRAYRGLKDFDAGAKVLDQFLKSVPPEKVGPLLANLAAGMQEEVERLVDAARDEEARRLAADAITTFTQLERWAVEAKRARAELSTIRAGLARLNHVAGQYAEGEKLVAALLKDEPRNGHYLRLAALLKTDSLGANPAKIELLTARQAWEELLKDPELRPRAPSRYWEARYNHLHLMFREGEAAEVAKAIASERVWYPEMGGPKWRARFDNLQRNAAAAAGLGPVVIPPAVSSPHPPSSSAPATGQAEPPR